MVHTSTTGSRDWSPLTLHCFLCKKSEFIVNFWMPLELCMVVFVHSLLHGVFLKRIEKLQP